MKDIIKGFKYLLSGFQLIKRPKIRSFVIVPLLINIVLFTIAIFLAFDWIDGFIESLTGWWEYLELLLWPLFFLFAVTVIFFGFSLLANIIAAPFNGILAEKVEFLLEEKPLPETNLHIGKEIMKVAGSEANKFFYFITRGLPLLLLSFIPGLQPLWLLFAAWMMALEYMDYPMGNHGMVFKEERQILKQRRALALGFGAGVMLMALIPILNFIVMPVAVCGATRLWVNEIKPQYLSN